MVKINQTVDGRWLESLLKVSQIQNENRAVRGGRSHFVAPRVPTNFKYSTRSLVAMNQLSTLKLSDTEERRERVTLYEINLEDSLIRLDSGHT